MFLLAISNSLLVEFFLRTILTGINFNYYLIRRIPLPSKTALSDLKNRIIINKLCNMTEEILKSPLEGYGYF